MTSAVHGTDEALRGLRDIYDRVIKFHAQNAFYLGQPVIMEGGEPKGIASNVENFRDRIFMGGFGCGKSYILDYVLLSLLANQPDNMGLIIRKRFEQLRNTTLATFYQLVEEATDGDRNRLIADVDEKDGAIQILIRTSGKPSLAIFRVEPDGSDESVRDSLKGYELGVFGMDEATQLKKVTYDTLRTRLRRPGFVLAGLVASNPARTSHWLTKVVQANEKALAVGDRPDSLIIRARSFDNPYLRSDYVEELKKQYKDDPAGYDMYVLGMDGMEIQGKPVFRRDFNEKVHTDQALKCNPLLPLYVGLDFGYHHPAAVWFQKDDRDRFNVLAELLPEDIGVDTFADMILDFQKVHFPHVKDIRYFGDPAGAQVTDKGDPTIKRLGDKGIPVRYMDSDILPGVECIRQLMQKMVDGRPKLVFHPRCKIIGEAMRGGYYFRQKQDGSYADKPFKDGLYDHLMDALRYGIVNLVLGAPQVHSLPARAEGLRRIEMN